MSIDPKQLASIIDSRAAELDAVSDDLVMESAGVTMALDKLRESLETVAEHLKNREYEKASEAGYQEVAHNFIFLQRTLAGLQTAEYRKQSFISEIAMAAKAAYEEIAPEVENRLGFSDSPQAQRPGEE